MMRRESKKQAKRNRQFAVVKKEYLEANPYCEIMEKCEGLPSVEVHHPAGRQGDNLFGPLKATCVICHKWAEANPEEARKKGVTISRHSSSKLSGVKQIK